MPEFLFIRLAEPSSECSSVVLDDAGRIVHPLRKGALALNSSAAGNRRVIALLPGLDVVTTTAELPKTSQARLRQLLPYSLEETFAEDVDSLLFASGRRLGSGELSVAVISKQRLDYWLEQLESAGIRADAVYADSEGVADTPGTLNLLLEGTQLYGRLPDQAPFVFESLSLKQLVELLESQGESVSELQHAQVFLDAHAVDLHQDALIELQQRFSSVDAMQLADGVLARLAATLVFQPGTNLLQGAYAAKSNWGELLRPWRLAASLFVAMMLFILGSQAAEYLTLQKEDQALTDILTATCQRNFSAARISNCSAEVQRRLSDAGEIALTSGESFLTTLATISQFRDQADVIQAMSYRNRIMDLRLTVSDVSSLDRFAQQIMQTERFDVRILATNPVEGAVEGRLQVSGTNL